MKIAVPHITLLLSLVIAGCSNSNDVSELSSPTQAANDDSTAPLIIDAIEAVALTGVVYTDTEIEIFWERSTDPTVSEYTVTRNDAVLTSIDALSFYDGNLAPGTTYEYAVFGNSSDSSQTAAATITLTTPEAAPVINVESAESIVRYVQSIADGELFNVEVRDIINLRNMLWDGTVAQNNFAELSSESDADGITRRLSCPLGGTLNVVQNYNATPDHSVEMDNCSSDFFSGASISATMFISNELSKQVDNIGIYTDITVDEFERCDTPTHCTQFDAVVSVGVQGGLSYLGRFVGRVDDNGEPVNDADGRQIIDFPPVSYVSPAFEGRTSLSAESIFERAFNFTIQSPATGNKPITAERELFDDLIVVTGDDGSRLTLDTEIETNDRALLTITSAQESASFEIDWLSSP